ncbi:BIG1-domain-containing protein [Sphaerulina musiva SO2202]|uniref:Protein BIG1 n=1 Tax=Sphaerulina musiva (strain SO2202) TaxID=692275 RepID=M3D0E6_SPHMS|nr:BIG1-domain-containing protein [Sphaerulina musiva SO2202]EMF09948.1 BIG1-domain-containing protein [Sphaerulina musiva SO2202]
MLLRSSIFLAATASSAYALRDASPFLLLSTEYLDQTSLRSEQLSTSTHIEGGLEPTLSLCGSSVYVFVEQPGVHGADLQSDTMPKLSRRVAKDQYRSVVQIPEVVGQVDAERVAAAVSRQCGAQRLSLEEFTSSTSKPTPAVIGPLVQTAPRGAHRLRAESLKQLDSDLDAHLHSILSNHTAHTIIFIGVPASGESSNLDYESENTPPGHNSMHTDLKRDVDHGFKRAEQSNSTNPQEKLALFEKYQFLSPGIFMGLVTVLLLLSILYVGVSAIAGLEVSYMSFSKEMGPNAQKKQQ